MAEFGKGDLIFFTMDKMCPGGLPNLIGIAVNKSRNHRFRWGSLMRNTRRSKWYCTVNRGNNIYPNQARQIADELDRLNNLSAGDPL